MPQPKMFIAKTRPWPMPAAVILAILLALTVAAAPPAPNDATIWVVDEPVWQAGQLDQVLALKPDVILRGTFKWGGADVYADRTPLIRKAWEQGTLYGGGVTCSAIYRGENKISAEQFDRLVARSPKGEPVVFGAVGPGSGGCFKGALEVREYQDYVLSWAYQQIDAGVGTLFMDEIDGAAEPRTGFTDAGLAAFHQYLIQKYVQGQGWKPDDPRWSKTFGIKLDDPAECRDGTINTFDYRAYLKRHKWPADPTLPRENPLADEWGSPRDVDPGTYCGQRNLAVWKYWVESIRAYARQKNRTVYIAANGLADLVDYQIEGVWYSWPVKDGRLGIETSFVPRWRAAIDWSHCTLGHEVPLVVFHDWGADIPWQKIPAADRILWLRVYAPEVFASGAFFAWPVSGCGGTTRADKNGTLETIRILTDWYRRNAALYHDVSWLGEGLARTEPLVLTTMLDQPKLNRRLVHVINKKLVGHTLVPRENLKLEIPSGEAPRLAWTVSPDFPDKRRDLLFHFEKQTISVTLDRLDAYTVIRLEYAQLPQDEAVLIPQVRLGTDGTWGRRGGRNFLLNRRGVARSDGTLCTCLHGHFHSEMRVAPTFEVEIASGGAGGSAAILVNSVAQMGARLVVQVDGKTALDEKLPDLDGKNDMKAGEYNRVFRVPVPSGRHRITFANEGEDWAAIDGYEFAGLK